MPGTNFRAEARRQLIIREKKKAQEVSTLLSAAGLTRQLQTPRIEDSDPSRGGCNGYEPHYRAAVLAYAENYSVRQASCIFDVSISSIYRWRINSERKKKQGGKERVILTGRDQLLLSLAIFINPTSTADEVAAFIYRSGGGVFQREQIYKRFKELGVSRKKASIEAYAAFTPRNILRARLFWTRGPPVGIVGIPRRKLIDIDETRFSLYKIKKNGKWGWAVKASRVRDTGEYRKGDASWNLLLGVEPGNPLIHSDELGSLNHPRLWFKITKENCDQYLFAEFIDEICRDIEQDPHLGDDERYFMWDNLSAHLTPLVRATLEMRVSADQHKFIAIARPPYQPKFAPVEYIIGQIATKLAKMHKSDWTLDSLRFALENICRTVCEGGVANDTFAFVGYD